MISSQYCNILRHFAELVNAEPIIVFAPIRPSIDMRICAAQYLLKSMYPTWQGNLSLRHLGREMHRHFAKVISLQNGADQFHIHRLSNDPDTEPL